MENIFHFHSVVVKVALITLIYIGNLQDAKFKNILSLRHNHCGPSHDTKTSKVFSHSFSRYNSEKLIQTLCTKNIFEGVPFLVKVETVGVQFNKKQTSFKDSDQKRNSCENTEELFLLTTISEKHLSI